MPTSKSARRLLRTPQVKSLQGTMLVVRVVNSFGFLNRSRYLPDRRDLNRCFPGSAKGSLSSRLAHIFLNEVMLRCDFGIDLRCARVMHARDTGEVVAEGDVFAAVADLFGGDEII